MLEIDALSPQRAQAPSRMLPPEWIAQIAALNPRFIVPSSCQFIQEDWSWQRQRYFPISYAQFEAEMVNLNRTSSFSAKTVRLNPGTSIELSPKAFKDSAPLSWIQPIGDQNVDYTFDLNDPADSIAEISKRLGPLTQKQRDRVSSFCREELTARYSELECVEPYFDQPRRWQLDVYDSAGQFEKFHYVVKGNELTPQSSAETQGEPEWLTEIPASKLFNALENGEALNSLYIRINDTRFSARVEQELEKTEADLLNDPLLRVLYEGKFGTYQKAQLRKLKAKNEV
ncbi:MAG: hypothetical protein EOP05_18065 [Proteobacteria bacterium]|nr:MAG: hypothetical protein EOP05_18065 [Pseudomonadota bacterium]